MPLLIILNCSLLLASHKLWCQARVLLCLYHWWANLLILNLLTSKFLQGIVPLFRRWIPKVHSTICWWCLIYSHVLAVPMHTGHLQPIAVLSDSVACTYLLLRCLLSDRYANLFIKVLVLSLLISRMLNWIFLIVSIIIIFHVWFGKLHISVEGFVTWTGRAPRVFMSLT